ncbi:MAG: hypothetical protein ACK4YD_10325 [Chitinophagia bacterium]|jgi:hypothetical protein
MKKHTRDLLLLRKDELESEDTIDREVASITRLLQTVETLQSLAIAFELIDLNRFKIQHDERSIGKAMRNGGLKPFEFLFNRN